MRKILFILLFISYSLLQAQIPAGFTALFNETDLTGWTRIGTSVPASVWQWEGGVLHTTQGSTGGTGWIQYNEKMFTDFEFYCEWKCGHNGNSGFQFDIAEDSEKPVWDAIEIQLCEDSTFTWWWEKNGFYMWDARQISGAIYGFAGATKSVYNGMDKWNTTLVKSYGDTIAVVFNGEEVVKVNRNDYTNRITMWNTERLALSERPRTGYIGLQSHKGGTTYFRNVAIKDLLTSTDEKVNDKKETLYPNPANNSFKMDLSHSDLADNQIKVINSAGEIVKQINAESSEFHVGNLNKGIYFVQVNYKNGTEYLRLIKN